MKHLTFLGITEDQLQEEVRNEANEWVNGAAKRIEEQHQRLLKLVDLSSVSVSDREQIERSLAAVAKQTREALLMAVTISTKLRGRFSCFPSLN